MSFDRSKKPTWRPGYRYQYEPAQKGHVLLYPEGMIKLNDSAALIGGLIGGKKGALVGTAEGAGGAALYTYKLDPKTRRYERVRVYNRY